MIQEKVYPQIKLLDALSVVSARRGSKRLNTEVIKSCYVVLVVHCRQLAGQRPQALYHRHVTYQKERVRQAKNESACLTRSKSTE